MFAMKQLALSPPCYVVYVSNDVPISTSSTFLGYSISQIDFLLMLESRFNDNPCRASFNLAGTLLIFMRESGVKGQRRGVSGPVGTEL